jgi:hypothetical protein
MSENALITPEYRAQQEHLHQTTNYGTASIGYAPLVSQIIERAEVTHLLDYGCGAKCNLARNLKVPHKITYQAYDPAVPEFASAPAPAQMVACIDVLEHIEPQCLKAVLDDLKALTEGIVFLTIHTGPAVKTLTDGRNAHLTQKPLTWWLPKLWKRWDLQTVQVTGEHGFYVIGFAKSQIEDADGKLLV